MTSYLGERVVVSIIDKKLDDDPICLLLKDKMIQRKSENLSEMKLNNLPSKSVRRLTILHLTSALVRLRSTSDENLSARTFTVVPVDQSSPDGNTSENVQEIPTPYTDTIGFLDTSETLQVPTPLYPGSSVSNPVNSEEVFYPVDNAISPIEGNINLGTRRNYHGQDNSCNRKTNKTYTSSFSRDTEIFSEAQCLKSDDLIQCNTSINSSVLCTKEGQTKLSIIGPAVPNEKMLYGIRHDHLSYVESIRLKELNIIQKDSSNSVTPRSKEDAANNYPSNNVFQENWSLLPTLRPITLVKNQLHADETLSLDSHDGDHECPVSVRNINHGATKVRKTKVALKKESNMKPKESLLLKCHPCSKTFCKSSDLFSHISKIHLATKPVVCSECQIEIKTPALFHRHQLVHLGLKRKFSCKSCPKTFVSAYSLNKHQKCHEQDKEGDDLQFSAKHLVCGVCRIFFISLQDRKEHSAVHSGKTPYVCTKCPKAFRWKKKLKKHEDSHTEKTPFVCKVCSRKFSEEKNFTAHKPFHIRKKAFMCGVCGRSVSKMRYILAHRRYHTGEKPYSCNLCSQSYHCSSSLLAHKRRVHCGRSHVCETCDKAFKTRPALTRHQRYHSGEKLYVCEICSKAFYLKHDLECHRRLHIGDRPFKCTLCDKTYVSKRALNWHVRKIHTRNYIPSASCPQICDICGKTFPSGARFTLHMKYHSGVKDHLCSVCGKAFVTLVDLRRHETMHAGQKFHVCETCGKRCPSKESLKKHHKIIHPEPRH